jgi:hypothetical protein
MTGLVVIKNSVHQQMLLANEIVCAPDKHLFYNLLFVSKVGVDPITMSIRGSNRLGCKCLYGQKYSSLFTQRSELKKK